MTITKEFLTVRSTNNKILQVYLRENNDSDDGIYYNELDKNAPLPTPAGSEINGTKIISKSIVSPGEVVDNIILDTNYLDNPSGYIISLCFSTFDGNTSKLYMGRVSTSAGNTIWTQCADSPKTYVNKRILEMFSSFLNINGGTPIKILTLQDIDDNSSSVIIEHH